MRKKEIKVLNDYLKIVLNKIEDKINYERRMTNQEEEDISDLWMTVDIENIAKRYIEEIEYYKKWKTIGRFHN